MLLNCSHGILDKPACAESCGNPDGHHGDVLRKHWSVRASRETEVVNLDRDSVRAADVPVARVDGALGRPPRWVRTLEETGCDPALVVYTTLTRPAATHMHNHAALATVLIKRTANLQESANVILRVPQLG